MSTATRLIPPFVTLMAVLPSQLTLPFLSRIIPTPDFALMTLFFWGLARPASMPLLVAFVVGLVRGALSGAPLGLHAFLYIMVLVVLHKVSRKVRLAHFWKVWGIFWACAFGYWLWHWLLLSFRESVLLPVDEAVIQWIVAGLFYPFLHLLMQKIDATLKHH